MKTLTVVRRFGGRFAAVAAVSAVAAAPAFADYADIVSGIEVGSVTNGIFLVGGAIGAILAIRMGVRKVLGMIR